MRASPVRSSLVPLSQFGRFLPLFSPRPTGSPPTLPPFPAPLPVPRGSVPVPHYVPRDFWGSPRLPKYPGRVPRGGRIKLGGEEEEKLRAAARLARDVLNRAGELVKPGVTTAAIDKELHELILSHGAYPSPLGYKGFPKSICTSINNVIAHGVPDERPLDEHDLINIDITVFLDGYHGDTSRTFLLPTAVSLVGDEEAHALVKVAQQSLEAGIAVCAAGVPYEEIGQAIESYAMEQGYLVCDLFTGHGISTEFHHPPQISHTSESAPEGVMQPGDCFTIEPSIEQLYVGPDGEVGGGDIWKDGWTVVTKTGARSAQFEHQILITDQGVDILTA